MRLSHLRATAAAVTAFIAAATMTPVWAAPTTGYQLPPAPITQVLDAPPTPGVMVSPERRTMAQIGRENLPSIAAVSEPILRLGGYRINPRNNGPIEARAAWLNSLAFGDVATGSVRPTPCPPGRASCRRAGHRTVRGWAFWSMPAVVLKCGSLTSKR